MKTNTAGQKFQALIHESGVRTISDSNGLIESRARRDGRALPGLASFGHEAKPQVSCPPEPGVTSSGRKGARFAHRWQSHDRSMITTRGLYRLRRIIVLDLQHGSLTRTPGRIDATHAPGSFAGLGTAQSPRLSGLEPL